MNSLPYSSLSIPVLKISLLAAVFYVLAQPLDLPFLMYAPLLVWGAFCLTLGRREVVIFTVLCLYLILSSAQFRVRTKAFIPFRSSDVTTIEGSLIHEASWNSRGNLILTLDLGQVVTEDGAEGAGEGEITVFLSGAEGEKARFWTRGDEILLSGKLHCSDSDQKSVSLYFYGDHIIRHSRIRTDSFRQWILKKVFDASSALGGISEILLPALVLGLKHPDQEGVITLFRETGTAHIVALSGFHSGLVALFIFSIFRFPLGYRKAMTAAAAGLLVYLYLAGLKPSLVRAVIMYMMPVVVRLCYRKADLKKVLMLSFLFTGLVMPESLHTLSARLSYLALWGILHTGPLIHTLLRPRLGAFLSLSLSASLSAQLWTLPLVLTTFGQWYPAGIPASIVLTPLITVYMYSGIFLIIFQGIPLLSFIPAALCRFIAGILPACAGVFGQLPHVRSEGMETGVFLILIFPLLLEAVYRPGGFCGRKRESESELRFHIRNKGTSGFNGVGTPQTVGAEFSD